MTILRDYPFAVLFAICAALWALAPPTARAGELNQESELNWHMADLCRRAAFKKFSDYTPEGNARRENYRRACMRDNGLPVPDGPATVHSQ
jgi:hypothetical protein